MINHNDTHDEKLHKQRQAVAVNMYNIIFLIAFVGGAMTSIFNNSVRRFPMGMFFAILILLFGSLYLILRFLKSRITNLILMDHILFFIGCFIFAISFSLSNLHPILLATIIFPLFFLLFVILLRRLHVILFTGVNAAMAIYLLITTPLSSTTITSVHYISFLISLLIACFGSFKLISLLQHFQKNILNDNQTLYENNLELTALNEEYYAAQEELHEQYNQIQYMAFNDTLTGLLNRMGFQNKTLPIISEHPGDFYVVYIDIETFSEINSAYGYGFGDELLRQVAERVKITLPEAVNMARIGNDIFSFILIESNMEVLLHRCMNSLKEPYQIGDDIVHADFRVGIAMHDGALQDIETLMTHADMALTKAKQESKNTFIIFDSNMKKTFNQQITLKASLSDAIKNQLPFMVYQPIIDVSDLAVSGYESLVRWIDDQLGFVSPGEFIPIAEHTQLIEPLGVLITTQVLDYVKSHGDILGTHTVFSINISGNELANSSFADNFMNLMEDYGISPDRIAVEVTETSLINDFDTALKNLQALKKASIKIYLDDFGTGYSSLNYLDQLPIDVIKIDQTFTRELIDNPKKRHLLSAIITLAAALDINTIAEGVETQDQYQLLRDMGINKVQGYLFSKPLPADEVASFYRDFTAK